MATKKKALQAAAGAAGGTEPLAIEDVFSTTLYTGTGSTQSISTGVNLNTTDTTVGYTSLLQDMYPTSTYKEFGLGKILEDDAGNYYVIIRFKDTNSGQVKNTVTKYSSSNQQLWSRVVSDGYSPAYASIKDLVFNSAGNPVVFWTPANVNNQLYVNVLDKDTGAVLATSNNSSYPTAPSNVLSSGSNLYWAGSSPGNTVYINSGTAPGTEVQAYRVSVGSSTSENAQKLMLIPQSDGQPVLVSYISDQNSGTSTNGFVFTKLASNLQSEVWSTRWSHSNGSSTQYSSRYMSPGEHYYDPVDNMLYVIWTGINSSSGTTTYYNYVSKFNVATGAHVISKRYYFNSASTANISARSITKFGNKIICVGKGYLSGIYYGIILEFDTNLTNTNVVAAPLGNNNGYDLKICAGSNFVYYHVANYNKYSEVRKFPEFSATEAVLGSTPLTGITTVTSASLTNTTTGYVPIAVTFGSPSDLMGATGSSLSVNSATLTYSTSTVPAITEPGPGGLVWIKWRSGSATPGASTDNIVVDTERGTSVYLETNSTSANKSATALSAFNLGGFTTGGALTDVDNSGDNYASWTWRKAPRWFDVVTWTGTGTPQNISHNLGVTPGCIMIKSTSISGNWWVWHRTLPDARYGLYLNGTSAQTTSNTTLDWTDPTDTVFRVGTSALTNSSGATYVAYLFAHDPLGPSGDGSDGLIACGSYTGNGLTDGPEINLGWEPQWVMVKIASGNTGDWKIFDTMRGIATGGTTYLLEPNTSDAEVANNDIDVAATGFKVINSNARINQSGATFIYIAIRRGPMRQPTSGTEVFQPVAYSGNSTSGRVISGFGFPIDAVITTRRNGAAENYVFDRLRGSNGTATKTLSTNRTDAETALTNRVLNIDRMDGYTVGTDTDVNASGATYIAEGLRRAPGFFDVVAYTGTGVARTVQHNLGVAPEMMWVKGRSYAEGWPVYHTGTGNTDYTRLNTTTATVPSSAYWNNTTPTETEFTVGTVDRVNFSGATYIAYLFATLPGVSKVGSYTGNGSSQTINCGFTGGARFVLIKRTDSTGDWYVWDTARGIVAGNDPYFRLNIAATEVTTDDSVDPDSSGFIVNQVAATNINVSSASYIYLAIA